MRDYAKVSPLFWTRGSGKRLRGDADAQVLALYLVTSPAANMIGIYYVPFVAIAHETGLGAERATSALARLATSGFAFYDLDGELAWVPNMASYQIGDELKEGDKRRGGAIRAELDKVGGHRFVAEFWQRYGLGYGLGPAPISKTETIDESGVLSRASNETITESAVPNSAPPSSSATPPAEGASGGEPLSTKGLRAQSTRAGAGAGEDQEEIHVQEAPPKVGAPPVIGSTVVSPSPDMAKPKASRGIRLDPDWRPPPDLVDRLRAKFRVDPLGSFDRFQNFWLAKAKDATKLDWGRTFANWVDSDVSSGKLPKLAIEDDLPILRHPDRDRWLREDRQEALPVAGFSFGVTK